MYLKTAEVTSSCIGQNYGLTGINIKFALYTYAFPTIVYEREDYMIQHLLEIRSKANCYAWMGAKW